MTAHETFDSIRNRELCDLMLDIARANPLLTFSDVYTMAERQFEELAAYAQNWDVSAALPSAEGLGFEREGMTRITWQDAAADLRVELWPEGAGRGQPTYYLDGGKSLGGSRGAIEFHSPDQLRAAARLLLTLAAEADPVGAQLVDQQPAMSPRAQALAEQICFTIAEAARQPSLRLSADSGFYVSPGVVRFGRINNDISELRYPPLITRDAAGNLWLQTLTTPPEPAELVRTCARVPGVAGLWALTTTANCLYLVTEAEVPALAQEGR